MTQPAIPVTVVMERREVASRWVSHEWRAHAVLPDDEASSHLSPATAGSAASAGSQYSRHPGFVVTLYRDEAEGYFLNIGTPDPKVFVMWRQEEGEESPTPREVTVSYNEAARWMDAQEKVDTVPMPASMQPWLSEYVAQHYKPEPKKKRIKASFVSARDKDRL